MAESETNHWFDERCARAFWDQQHSAPYRRLLRDTLGYAAPEAGERWLDLGCGGGQLTAGVWEHSGGTVEILAMDCAAVNEAAIAALRERVQPSADTERIRFQVGNLSDGLPSLRDEQFHGVVSGLALSYAESRDPVSGQYTRTAFQHIFNELYRVLQPGGRLVFSINVPEPKFWRIMWKSFRRGGRFTLRNVGRVLVNAIRMQRYGAWLKREARKGRFHYLPLPELVAHLEQAGFRDSEATLSYAGQAFVIRTFKPRALAA